MKVLARGLLFLLASGSCFIAPRDAEAFEFGACVHLMLGRSDAATVLQHLDAAGMTTFRDDIYWSGVEHEQGTLQLAKSHEQVKLAAQGLGQRSKSALLILDFGNKLYDGGGLIVSPEGRAAFARYADFVVRSFGDSVNRYEVWNEWNTGFGSKPKTDHGDAGDYVGLLDEASKAIKKANPRATVIGGATAGVDLKWWREFIDADGLRHVDAISVHSYTLFRQKENPEGAIRSLERLHAMVEAANVGREIPIYVTEMGFPTNKGKHGVSERDAAKYLARFMTLARSRPWVRGVWWYDLFDDGDNDSKAEHRFGLVTRDLRLKPAYIVARDIAPLVLADSKFASYRTRANGYVVTGTDAKGNWAMAWSMERTFLDWADGQTTEPPAPDVLEALSSELSPDGFPTLFRHNGGAWKADPDWIKEHFRRIPAAPSGLRTQK